MGAAAILSEMAALEPRSPEFEPELTTDPELAEVAAELRIREPIFHRAEFGTTPSDFERMTVADFWEVGASGRRYSRQYVLDSLKKRHSSPHEDIWEVKNFHCRRLGHDIYLASYTLIQDKTRVTRRSTIWQSTSGGWKIVFHQGTIVLDV
jgi:hypothetical protein